MPRPTGTTIDRLMTQMQETGRFPVDHLTVQEVYEVVTDLGIDPRDVFIADGEAICYGETT